MTKNLIASFSFSRSLVMVSALSLGLVACSSHKKERDLILPENHLVGVDRSATGEIGFDQCCCSSSDKGKRTVGRCACNLSYSFRSYQ